MNYPSSFQVIITLPTGRDNREPGNQFQSEQNIMQKIQKIKGTQDILPPESEKWQFVENTIRDIMHRYGYHEIRTPIFEETALFARGIGQLTDIVSKEMYTFEDRGKKSLTLKPEGTAPVMRAVIEHSLTVARPVNKLYYISPFFRQENPQSGRFRQFHQFGAEIIGSPMPEADVETILLGLDIYRALGLSSFVLKINSVGDAESRVNYKNVLKEWLKPHFDALCRTCQERYEQNPLRILDCKETECRRITAGAPKMIDNLTPAAEEHFRAVLRMLEENDVAFEIDHRLVRGLDYYTYTAYEFIGSSLGAQNALGGGGRYDLLAQELGGKPTPSVGFAAGIERLLMALDAENLLPETALRPDMYIATPGAEGRTQAYKLAQELRAQGIRVETDLLGRSLKAQMREANRHGARLVAIAGESELQAGKVVLKNLESGEQQDVSLAQLGELVRKMLVPIDPQTATVRAENRDS